MWRTLELTLRSERTPEGGELWRDNHNGALECPSGLGVDTGWDICAHLCSFQSPSHVTVKILRVHLRQPHNNERGECSRRAKQIPGGGKQMNGHLLAVVASSPSPDQCSIQHAET